MSTVPSRTNQPGGAASKRRRGEVGTPEAPGKPMPPDLSTPLAISTTLPTSHGSLPPPSEPFPGLGPPPQQQVMPTQPYPPVVYPPQPPPPFEPGFAQPPNSPPGGPNSVTPQTAAAAAAAAAAVAVAALRANEQTGSGGGQQATPKAPPQPYGRGPQPAQAKLMPNAVAPGMEYDVMMSNGMNPSAPIAPQPPKAMPPQVPPMNGLCNGQMVHVNNGGPPPSVPQMAGNVSQNLQRLLSMAGVSPQALNFLNSTSANGSSAALQTQLESQLKHAIVQGQPMQHIKLLIEDQLRLEEKKQKKRAANRRSASSSRARKKKYIEKLTTENRRLQRISRILAILPDLVMVVNEEGRITFASWRSQKMLQFPDALVGRNIFQLSSPECHAKISNAISETLKDLMAGEAKPEPMEPVRSISSSSSGSGASASATPQFKPDMAGGSDSNDMPHHSRDVGRNAQMASGAQHQLSDSSDDSSDGSFGSDRGGGRPVSSGGHSGYHHSSGGLHSEKQCAQRAPSSSDEDGHGVAALMSKDRREDRKNQVCLIRQDGTRMWCMMRATGFQRPSLPDDRESLLDGGASDEEETHSMASSSNNNEMFGASAGNQPEIILSFRPVDSLDDCTGHGSSVSQSNKSAQPQQQGAQAPQRWEQQNGAPDTSNGPAAKKRIVASGPQSVPTALPVGLVDSRRTGSSTQSGSNPAMSVSSSGSESTGTDVLPPSSNGQRSQQHGSKRRMGPTGPVAPPPAPTAPVPVHGVGQSHHAYYHRHHQLQQQQPLMHQPSPQQIPPTMRHQSSSHHHHVQPQQHHHQQPQPSLHQLQEQQSQPPPQPLPQHQPPPQQQASQPSSSSEQNHRAIELEAARSLVRIMNFASGPSPSPSMEQGETREI